MHLLFVLIIVIKVGQLALILGGRGVVQGGLQGSKALVYRHLLTHGIHGIFGVPTFSQAFETFAEKIPILAKKTHHPRIRHLLTTPAPSKLQLGSLSVLYFTEVFVLKAYNPELIFFFMSFHISLMRLDPAVSGQVWIWVPRRERGGGKKRGENKELGTNDRNGQYLQHLNLVSINNTNRAPVLGSIL